jgi:UDP-glucose 6-dehydrogenase
VSGADTLLFLTEWDAYAALDWPRLAKLAAPGAMIFDGRGIVDHARAHAAGFKIFAIGKGGR